MEYRNILLIKMSSLGDILHTLPFAAALRNQAEFDQLARVYNAGTPLAQPHVIFVIDRQAKPARRLYFINTPRFQLHDRFLREQGLLAGGKEAVNLSLIPRFSKMEIYFSEPNKRSRSSSREIKNFETPGSPCRPERPLS